MEDILIDTDVAIDYLRSHDKASTMLVRLMRQYNTSVSSITEFELFLGAKSDRHMNDLEMLFDEMNVLPFDFGCGRIASDIWKKLRENHQHAEIKDVFIASIAIRNGICLCTFNRKHFRAIPDVVLFDEKQI
ncbi:MAG: type II toxin-antitoxin system VapC family toxin [Desulfobacterales bacterium]|nr:type II toxin-antitoxin system VapC family toxin [Desulfobacterales bacterium]